MLIKYNIAYVIIYVFSMYNYKINKARNKMNETKTNILNKKTL